MGDESATRLVEATLWLNLIFEQAIAGSRKFGPGTGVNSPT